MPPLRQPRTLFDCGCSSISIYLARAIRVCNDSDQLEKLTAILRHLPRLISETLYYWVVRSGFLMIKVETDTDDCVVLQDHCSFIVKILQVILQSNMKRIEQDFTIDLRNFGNFKLDNNADHDDTDLKDLGIKVG